MLQLYSITKRIKRNSVSLHTPVTQLIILANITRNKSLIIIFNPFVWLNFDPLLCVSFNQIAVKQLELFVESVTFALQQTIKDATYTPFLRYREGQLV